MSKVMRSYGLTKGGSTASILGWILPCRGSDLCPVSWTFVPDNPPDDFFPNWCWHTEAGSAHPGGPAVIFDIDGVLSDAAGRQHFIEQGNRDWSAFFEACGDDPVIEEIARLLELLDSSLAVVLLDRPPLAGAASDAGLASPLRPALGPAGDAGEG